MSGIVLEKDLCIKCQEATCKSCSGGQQFEVLATKTKKIKGSGKVVVSRQLRCACCGHSETRR